ncbi:MAG: hypothetical protein DMF50_00130 [Acidobacteria bacterium]|nr:MAG: hypothetical protein DMF50_00130 [Acidobacteriota bacterium]
MNRARAAVLPLLLALLAAGHTARAQEPEVIVLDPNRPLIQNPGTVRYGAGGSATLAPAPELVSLPVQGVNAREVLAGLWFRQRALVEKGDTEGAARQMKSALEFMKREGLRAAPEIAAAFLAVARRSLVEGDYRRAKESFALAARFEPWLPAAHFGMALALLKGDRDLPGAFAEWWEGLRASAGEPGSFFYLAGNVFLCALLGLLLGACVGLLLLGKRSAPAFFHDLMERSSGRLSEGAARLLGWTLLALPLLVPVPAVWALAIWTALFFGYLRGMEKTVAVAALLLLLAAAPGGRLIAWHFGTAADPAARALILAADESHGLQHEEALKGLARDHPEEEMFPFLLGSAYRAGGRIDEAIAEYNKALLIDPRDARALVNLGNLYFLRQQLPAAIARYREASEADPNLMVAHYNSHLAHAEAFHLEAAEEELALARRLDDARVTELLARGPAERGKSAPLDARYPARAIWVRALTLRLEGGLRQQALGALTSPAALAGTSGLLAALFLPGLGIAPRAGAARRCRRCGRPFCRRCQVTTKYPDSCAQCMHLFILRDGVAPGVKNKKMEEVARYRRRVDLGARVLNLVMPGGGHVLGGRTLAGTALLMAWCGLAFAIASRGSLLVSPEWIAPASGSIAMLPLAFAWLVVWLIGNLTPHEPAQE